MESMRKPLFFTALTLIFITVLIELGVSLALGGQEIVPPNAVQSLLSAMPKPPDGVSVSDLQNARNNHDAPPGLGIPYLALVDGLILFSVSLMGLSLLIPARVHGRIQGVATFIFGLVILTGAIAMIFAAISLLMLMIALFTAVPFGTIVYMVIYGFFEVGGASASLTLIMLLKLCFAGCLVFAHQRFLQNKGLVLIVLTSLLATVIVSFLHSLVPVFLVSITDAVAAIIVAILAVVWAIFFLFGSIPSVIKVLRADRAA